MGPKYQVSVHHYSIRKMYRGGKETLRKKATRRRKKFIKAKFSKLHKSSLSTATGLNMCSIDPKYFPTCFLMFWGTQRYQIHTLKMFLAKLLAYFDVKTHLTKPFFNTTMEAKIVILVSNLENHLNTVSSRFVISKYILPL